MKRFRGGLVFKAHRLCVSLNSRLESNKEEEDPVGTQGISLTRENAGRNWTSKEEGNGPAPEASSLDPVARQAQPDGFPPQVLPVCFAHLVQVVFDLKMLSAR